MIFTVTFLVLLGLATGLATLTGGPNAGLAMAALAGGAAWAAHPPPRQRLARLVMLALAAVICVVFGLAALTALTAPAMAAEPAPASPTVEAIRPIVEVVVGAAVTAFLGWLYKRLSEQFGIKVDAERRATLHSALTTAANLMLSRVAASGQASLGEGVIQVWQGAREAIQHFGLKDEAIEMMLRAKLQESDVMHLSEPTPRGSAIVARRPETGRPDRGD